MLENVVEPLHRPVEMNLHPARRTHDRASTETSRANEKAARERRSPLPVFFAPTFDEAHSNGAYSCEIIDGFVAVLDGFT